MTVQGTQSIQLVAPINANPAKRGWGEGSAGKGQGFDNFLKLFLSYSLGSETNVNQKSQKKPHPGAKSLNKQYHNTI